MKFRGFKLKVQIVNSIDLVNYSGKSLVWASGTFQVSWRLKIDEQTFLGDITFITAIENGYIIINAILTRVRPRVTYHWKAADLSAFPVNEWFSLPVGTITIKCDKPLTVQFSVHQFDLDYKYCTDYTVSN